MRVLNKKGVSPIIAVLLLIVITVTAALLTYLWVLGYIGSAQKSGQPPEQLEEKIKIDGVKVSGNTITIYVRNIGSVRVVIQAVYILNATTGAVIDANTNLNVGLDPGQVSGDTDVQITVSGTYTSGYTYVAKVVTKKGTEASLAFTWP